MPGSTLTDISRIVHFNDNVKAFAEFALISACRWSGPTSGWRVEHGHIGCADQLFALERHLADGELSAGDLVALTSMGSGMHWTCTLLRSYQAGEDRSERRHRGT